MTAPKTVPAAAGVHMEVTRPFRHLCPFRDEVDKGRITIAWTTAGQTFELHGLAEFLDSFRDLVISHEDLTALVREVLDHAGGLSGVAVRTWFDTAGMGVHCCTLPTHAGTP
jgi:NADPH-dependent 7-cyano-7-deazaguanine reductase QueF